MVNNPSLEDELRALLLVNLPFRRTDVLGSDLEDILSTSGILNLNQVAGSPRRDSMGPLGIRLDPKKDLHGHLWIPSDNGSVGAVGATKKALTGP